ncbi:sigma-54-dependent transcriptional regulator [Anaeromyxobacter diazotrophicus]|uniref:Acetoacetate metabolism regulatory protein AtoC n=1 Tax=Anaeromyxobacter diazotrophicus TaxID=2590199 RepID=A0A7I9VRF3_9BACT|nr:sigma-54 dependent transcriptional regulator [Anaeromyxobacter diazotrophicus]GEJ59014.1 acetoacetate metabolism regulatory protein AtoC [Anaeromyxobacter diazotrophicus]
MTPRVLVVDDDPGLRYTLREILSGEGIEVEEAADGAEALARFEASPFPLVVTDLRMPGLDGLELTRRLAARSPPPRVVVVTAHGSERQAVEAMKAGAWDYFRKPFENDELLAVVRRALEAAHLVEENARLTGALALSGSLVFASPAMARLAELVARVGPRDVTVLIEGESGTGKERVAEALWRASRRADRPLVRFNCAALSPELAEAELFGHARGAFTGAVRARAGLFGEADGGTLLLDEIGDLAPAAQAKLLRVLQDGEVRAVGEDRARRVDVRVLAATHRDLRAQVARGAFREDLLYRLDVVKLHLPPLRERPEDIPLLARHFLALFSARFGVQCPPPGPELLARLAAHPWPGNVRELEHALESLVALSPEGELDLALVPAAGGGAPAAPPLGLKQRVEAYERGLLVDALREAGGRRAEAARALGISRVTLHDKLRKYALGPDGDGGG